jgi:thiamine-monophosphate kinase
MTTLRDLGERKIISTILPKYCRPAGDDCAIVGLGDVDVVLTTDPAPDPAARVIGGDEDPYWLGWLLVTINASDLGAAAATPLAFLSAIECQPDMEVGRFERLLTGIAESCRAEGLEYVGGNLKEAAKLVATGIAVGYCVKGKALGRKGAKDGDILLSVGRGGIFWRDALSIKNGNPVADKTLSPIFKPVSQMKNMSILAASVPIAVAMDNSDGLLATVEQLASINDMSIIIDLEQLTVPDAKKLSVDEWRLWLGWGDWNVLVGTAPKDASAILQIAKDEGFSASVIGEFKSGTPRAFVKRGEAVRLAPRLESERFAADSWFSSGIDGYIKTLLTLDLP